MKITKFQTLLLITLVLGLTTQPSQSAWLKTYSPGKDIRGFGVRQSPTGGFYLFGMKKSGQFAIKVDESGTIKWGKQLLSPIKVENRSITLTPPFIHMVSTPYQMKTLPFLWGQLSLDDNNGTLKKVYAKTFANKLDGQFVLEGQGQDNEKTAGYLINGSINSAIRKGPKVAGGDIAIAKVNTTDGSLAWSHIFGFDLGGLIPVSPTNFPLVTHQQGYYVFSRNMTLTHGSEGKASTWTVVGKIDETTGKLIDKPIMIDGMPGVHWVLKDGSIIVHAYPFNAATLNVDCIIIKFDNNLKFLWGKRYVSAPGSAYPVVLSTTSQEMADGTLELVGEHILKNAPFDSRPLVVHISAADGSVVTQKEVQFGSKEAIGVSAYHNDETPAAFELFRGATDSKEASGKRDLVFGRFDQNLESQWQGALLGAATTSAEAEKSHVRNSYGLLPNDGNTASSYRLWGMTSLGTEGPNLLLGLLDASGTIPGCSALSSIKPTLTTPNIVAETVDVSKLIHSATIVTDYGELPTKVIEAKVPELKIADMPLQETSICK